MPSTPSSAPSDGRRRRRVGIGTFVLVGVLVLAVIAVVATIQADSSESPGSNPPPGRAVQKGIASPGTAAPGFDLPRLRGPGRVKLADLKGQPVMVNFWASWCVPCRKEFPLFRKAYAKYRKDGLQIVGITFKDLTGDARSFAKQQRATWDLVDGGEGDPVGRAYGVRALPQTFFIDRRGVIIARYFGAPSGDRFDAEVRKIIAS